MLINLTAEGSTYQDLTDQLEQALAEFQDGTGTTATLYSEGQATLVRRDPYVDGSEVGQRPVYTLTNMYDVRPTTP